MTLRRCLDCTTRFAVGAPACPHCGGGDHVEAGVPTVWRCQTDGCTGLYRARLTTCGRCHGTDLREEEYMPKITVAGGPSHADDPEPETAVVIGADWSEDEPGREDVTPSEPAAERGDAEGSPSDGVAPATGADDEPPVYEDMTVAQLREECKGRDLPTSGTKAELIARLQDAGGDAS